MISLLTFGVLVINILPLNLKFILPACSVIMEHIWGIFPLPAGTEAFSGEGAEEILQEEKRFPSWFLCLLGRLLLHDFFWHQTSSIPGFLQDMAASSSPLAPVLPPRQLGSKHRASGYCSTCSFPRAWLLQSMEANSSCEQLPPTTTSRQISGKFQKIDFQQVASEPSKG